MRGGNGKSKPSGEEAGYRSPDRNRTYKDGRLSRRVRHDPATTKRFEQPLRQKGRSDRAGKRGRCSPIEGPSKRSGSTSIQRCHPLKIGIGTVGKCDERNRRNKNDC